MHLQVHTAVRVIREKRMSEDDQVEVREGRRVPLSLRTTQSVRTRLADAALKSGRSLTQEVEFRLEKSLEQDSLVKTYENLARAADDVMAVIGSGDTRHLLMRIAEGIAAIEEAQGTKWCTEKADLDAYDLNLADTMESIRRFRLKRRQATMSDYIAMAAPFAAKDGPVFVQNGSEDQGKN
jgi:hypothetical protein